METSNRPLLKSDYEMLKPRDSVLKCGTKTTPMTLKPSNSYIHTGITDITDIDT